MFIKKKSHTGLCHPAKMTLCASYLVTPLRVLPLSKRKYEQVGLLVVVDERRLLHDHLALVAPLQLLDEGGGRGGGRTVAVAHVDQARLGWSQGQGSVGRVRVRVSVRVRRWG